MPLSRAFESIITLNLVQGNFDLSAHESPIVIKTLYSEREVFKFWVILTHMRMGHYAVKPMV